MIPERAVVLVPGGNKELRPGVVLRRIEMEGSVRLFVAYGTGTYRPERNPVSIDPNDRFGRALGIYKPTHFYQGNSTICAETSAQWDNRLCPPALFIRLRQLMGW